MANITYPFLFLFAIAPSLIWLAFYLRKDSHPEPNRMILKIFFLGALATIPAIYVETFLEGVISSLQLPETAFLLVYFIFGIALVEELLKYLAFRLGARSALALDEPLDVMLYMVISALGFAALENILLLFGLIQIYPVSDIFIVNSVRLVEAVFLHTLASGIFGYFLALSFVRSKASNMLFFTGIALATLLHGLFNYYIFTIGGQNFLYLLAPIIPLFVIGIFISFGFQKLKQIVWSKKLP